MSLGTVLGLTLVASLATAASGDLRLDVRAESRTTTVAPEGFRPYAREALLARPGAAVVVDEAPVRAIASYGATIWTSDVEVSPSPRVTHDGQLRLETRSAARWRAGATGSAARGWTDPLAAVPVQALARQGPSPFPALVPIEFEALRAGADGSFTVDERSSIGADASVARTGAVKSADRATYPVQSSVDARLSLEHLVSPRNTLQLAASASATRTALAAGTDESLWATAIARSRFRMTPTLDCWGGAGAGVSRRVPPGAAPELRPHPAGEIGIAYEFERGGAELSGQTRPVTDRLTGDVVLMFRGTGALRWRESARLTFGVSASADATWSGDTALAALDARATYALTDRTSLDAAIVGRWQRERGTGAPSFAEVGMVVALAWNSGPFRR